MYIVLNLANVLKTRSSHLSLEDYSTIISYFKKRYEKALALFSNNTITINNALSRATRNVLNCERKGFAKLHASTFIAHSYFTII